MQQLSEHKISEVMRTAVVTIEEDATIVEAAKMMRVRNVGGLPVTNSSGIYFNYCKFSKVTSSV